MSEYRKRLFEIIQIGSSNDYPSRAFDYSIVFVIILNLTVTLLQTFDELEAFSTLFNTLELITIVIFTIEYIFRLWTAPEMFPKKSSLGAVFAFMISFYGIIDLLTILPFYLPFVFPDGAVAFRIFRVVRIFRLFRVNAKYDAFNVITDVLKEKKNQLFSSVCMIGILIIASSLCMYSLEHEAQPEQFRNAFSGIWWSVSTLLTVGYGDIYPITVVGRIMAIVISFLGVAMVAIPTGIISAGFVEQYSSLKKVRPGYENREYSTIVSKLYDGHEYIGKKMSEIVLPPQMIVVMIIRDDEVIVPNGDTVLMCDDKLVLGGKN